MRARLCVTLRCTKDRRAIKSDAFAFVKYAVIHLDVRSRLNAFIVIDRRTYVLVIPARATKTGRIPRACRARKNEPTRIRASYIRGGGV